VEVGGGGKRTDGNVELEGGKWTAQEVKVRGGKHKYGRAKQRYWGKEKLRENGKSEREMRKIMGKEVGGGKWKYGNKRVLESKLEREWSVEGNKEVRGRGEQGKGKGKY